MRAAHVSQACLRLNWPLVSCHSIKSTSTIKGWFFITCHATVDTIAHAVVQDLHVLATINARTEVDTFNRELSASGQMGTPEHGDCWIFFGLIIEINPTLSTLTQITMIVGFSFGLTCWALPWEYICWAISNCQGHHKSAHLGASLSMKRSVRAGDFWRARCPHVWTRGFLNKSRAFLKITLSTSFEKGHFGLTTLMTPLRPRPNNEHIHHEKKLPAEYSKTVALYINIYSLLSYLYK